MIRALFFYAAFLIFSHSAHAEKHYIGVVDVGSTGSRLHVYAHDTQSDRMDEVWLKKITPGFATLKPTKTNINQYLSELFQDAPHDFPVYFYATAGMRLLPDEHQQKYYQAVKTWFQVKPWDLQEAKTMTGREEGVFAWLSLYDALQKKNQNKKMPEHLSVMDMGGASVQVVTAVDSSSKMNPKDYIDLDLKGSKQTLFVHSFLGLGQTLVSEQFLDEPSCFPVGYPLPDGAVGEGNASLCASHISKLIEGVHGVNSRLHPALRAAEFKTWYVMAGLPYLIEEAPFNQNQYEITNDALLEQANQAVCDRSWGDIQAAYPDEKNVSRACLVASYYYALMEAYEISPNEKIHLISNTQKSVDWTLGVALHHH